MIEIRQAKAQDIAILEGLAQKLVPDTFQSALNTTQIDYMLEKYYSQKALQNAIDAGKIYFMANYDGEDTATTSLIQQGPDLFLMKKLYVEQKNLGKGIGSALFNHVINYVKEIHQGPCTLELLINQHNPGMNFYIHKGMVKVRDTGFDMGDFFINEEVLSLEIK